MQVAVVIHPDHEVIPSYFQENTSRLFKEAFDLEFILDDSRSGPGGALLKAKDFIDDRPFLTVFSDAPMRGSDRGNHLRRLMTKAERNKAAAALSLYRIPASETSRRGIVTFEEKEIRKEGVQITGMIEKPKVAGDSQSYWASACRYLVGPEVMRALQEMEPDEKGELQLTEGIRQIITSQKKVLGLPLEEKMSRHDTGNFEGYYEAFAAFTDGD